MDFSFYRRILNFFNSTDTDVNEITSFEEIPDLEEADNSDERLSDFTIEEAERYLYGESNQISQPFPGYHLESYSTFYIDSPILIKLQVQKSTENLIIPEELYLDFKKLEDDNLICPVCLEIIFTDVIITNPCNHKFCETCINSSLKNNNKCPYCRTEIISSDKSKFFTDMISNSLIHCSNDFCIEKIKKHDYFEHKKICLFSE